MLLKTLNRTSKDLRELQGLSREEYLADENQLQRDAAERKFEKLTAAVIDISKTILRAENVTIPNTRKATIAAFNKQGIIDSCLKAKLEAAVGFRDVLAHSHGPIVKDVYSPWLPSISISRKESRAIWVLVVFSQLA